MDWGLEYYRICQNDLNTVFKYGQRKTTVFRMLASEKESSTTPLTSSTDWRAWFEQGVFPRLSSDAGLVFVLAQRALEQEHEHRERVIRYLPFSKEIFSRITKEFFVHRSISRAISRGDDAVFSRIHTSIEIGGARYPAIVYNCRAANAWGHDMALSMTFFPGTGRTYAILFGCTAEVEKRVLARLRESGQAALHPMTLPGIFAELEQDRHVELAELSIDALESKILNFDKSVEDVPPGSSGGKVSGSLRIKCDDTIDFWLDTNYLRNGLHNWKAQLLKMADHSIELSNTIFRTDETNLKPTHIDEGVDIPNESNTDNYKRLMRDWGLRLKDGIQDIINKYDEKIRDCTIRVDGMTMETQLSHTRTNMQIALATKQDGSQMKSIAFLTMVFLPPTFVATLFSMSIFNWFPDKGKGVISPYFWIYIVVTSTLTLGTVGLWFYLSIYRRRRKIRS